MKYFAAGVSLLSLIILLTYIRYNEHKSKKYLTRYEAVTNTNFPDKVNARTLALPDTLAFAGEEVPLEKPQVQERLYRELLVNTYWHSNTLLMIVQANRWLPEIERILVANGLPADFKYIPVIEGSLRNDISPAGAVGFWQLLAATAREHGLEVSDDVDERYHPIKSTEAASSYLRRAYSKFYGWTEVAASYNRGMAGLSRAMESQKTSSYYDLYLNEETARYVYRILAIKLILENPEAYGFVVDEEHLFAPIPVKQVIISESIDDLPEFANSLGISYGTLKYHNPWLRDYNLKVPKGKTYVIDVPVLPE
jgi:membrane-bound lytic murein transglycosylase D